MATDFAALTWRSPQIFSGAPKSKPSGTSNSRDEPTEQGDMADHPLPRTDYMGERTAPAIVQQVTRAMPSFSKRIKTVGELQKIVAKVWTSSSAQLPAQSDYDCYNRFPNSPSSFCSPTRSPYHPSSRPFRPTTTTASPSTLSRTSQSLTTSRKVLALRKRQHFSYGRGLPRSRCTEEH